MAGVLGIATIWNFDWKEGGAEVIGGEVDGLYGAYQQQEGIGIFIFWAQSD
jgi:hypothetical protein